jgi:single-stranded-DNA-specific exonuclease
VAAAKARGIKVLVTDHHLPSECLPHADAIVNPNLPNDHFPSKHLAGVGTIFYVMLALRAHLRDIGYFTRTQRAEPNLAALLDLVALGTVADVVPLDTNNRILVSQGLARIRAGKCGPGLLALLKVAGRRVERISASDLAFAVAPRINAAGRLEDMSVGIACLLSEDEDQAMELAVRLDELNRDRKTIEADMKDQALEIIEHMQLSDEREFPVGLCLYDPDWHQGVIGILASRIKDKLHRPVIAFASANSGYSKDRLPELKGSARSIPGVHIRDVLDAVAKRHPNLLKKFGGHAMAAGMTIRREDFDAFAKAFNEQVDRCIDHEMLCNHVITDGPLRDEDFTLELAETLRHAGPWGQQFPEPLFDNEFRIVDRRIVGERHIKCRLQLDRGSKHMEGIWFFPSRPDCLDGVERAHLAYQLDINEYNGTQSLQLIIRHALITA